MTATALPLQSLPEVLPAEPLTLAAQWLALATARGDVPNPNAMVLATADAAGHPSARVVLCKDIEPVPGLIRFFTNYESRKGSELAANPRAALVFHWDHLHRQVRVEGVTRKASSAASDRYFASRPRASQLGAHASRQSRPVATAAALRAQLDATIVRFGETPVPRPEHWGGYELWADAVELWVEDTARLHDRARWSRTLTAGDGGVLTPGSWQSTRLQP
jgi:pyridoxamine 5'-phosphate oxidase